VLIGFGTVGVFADGISFSDDLVFVRYQAFDAYRSTWVKFAGRDADFGAESVTETISKTTRGI